MASVNVVVDDPFAGMPLREAAYRLLQGRPAYAHGIGGGVERGRLAIVADRQGIPRNTLGRALWADERFKRDGERWGVRIMGMQALCTACGCACISVQMCAIACNFVHLSPFAHKTYATSFAPRTSQTQKVNSKIRLVFWF